MKKHGLIYVVTIIVFSVLSYFFIYKGRALEQAEMPTQLEAQPMADANALSIFLAQFTEGMHHPLPMLLLQIVIILAVARAFSWVFIRMGQPVVIGEIVAGIALGPSLLGYFLPEVKDFIFPSSSLPALQYLSQIGLVLFMFIIGMELDVKVLRKKAQDAVFISHASIVFPYFLGIGLAYFTYSEFAPDNVPFLSYALFMGIAMSITAFPVLARILQERGMTKTRLGTVAITCAAADDVTAWCILAAVIAIVKAGSLTSALFTVVLSVAYVLIMFGVVQPLMRKVGEKYTSKETITKPVIAFIFFLLLLSAYATEIIGIHALFGAFVAGVIMPQNIDFKSVLTDKVEDVALVLLLPLFFVYTGLRTEIGLLNTPYLWTVCGVVILVAVTGKFAGSAIAARFVGHNWKDSLALGALMNTRGLMELVVLNIGFELGILSKEIFAILVLMALITTFMTGPSLDLILKYFKDTTAQHIQKGGILLSFGPAKMGATLLKLADSLLGDKQEERVTALHITPATDINRNEAAQFEKDAFLQIKNEAKRRNIQLQPIYKASEDVSKEIVSTTEKGEHTFLLMGSSRSIFTETFVGGIVKNVLEDTVCKAGVLMDRKFQKAEQLLVLIQNGQDAHVLDVALQMAKPRTKIHLWSAQDEQIIHQKWAKVQVQPEVISAQLDPTEFTPAQLDEYDLVLISLEYWKILEDLKPVWIPYAPSILILKSCTSSDLAAS